jgi:hypothetical protein
VSRQYQPLFSVAVKVRDELVKKAQDLVVKTEYAAKVHYGPRSAKAKEVCSAPQKLDTRYNQL